MCVRLWEDGGSVMGSMLEDPMGWSKWGASLALPIFAEFEVKL